MCNAVSVSFFKFLIIFFTDGGFLFCVDFLPFIRLLSLNKRVAGQKKYFCRNRKCANNGSENTRKRANNCSENTPKRASNCLENTRKRAINYKKGLKMRKKRGIIKP